nr:MAG TPA: hypothetical protein [Inoviridae sp.]
MSWMCFVGIFRLLNFDWAILAFFLRNLTF